MAYNENSGHRLTGKHPSTHLQAGCYWQPASPIHPAHKPDSPSTHICIDRLCKKCENHFQCSSGRRALPLFASPSNRGRACKLQVLCSHMRLSTVQQAAARSCLSCVHGKTAGQCLASCCTVTQLPAMLVSILGNGNVAFSRSRPLRLPSKMAAARRTLAKIVLRSAGE